MTLIQKLNRKPYLLPGLLLLLHVITWILMHPLMPNGPGDDAFQYVQDAKNVFSSGFHLSFDQYQNRFGVYIPVHFIFLLFGISPYTISLWPLFISSMTILLVYVFLSRLAGRRVALLASALIAMNLEQVTFSLVLFPDLLVAFYATAVILLLYGARQMSRRKILSALWIHLLWIAGFLTKETMLLTIPFIVLMAIYDLARKKHLDFWKPALLFSLISLIVLSGFYYFLTGDPFHRIRSMTDFVTTKVNPGDDQADNIRAHNSSHLLIWINHNLHYLFILVLSIPVIFRCFQEKWSGLRKYLSLYALYFLITLASLFHSPHMGFIYLQSRHWMFLIAPLSILAAWFIQDANKTSLRFVIGAFIALGVYNFMAVGPVRSLLFLLFVLGAGADYYFFLYKGKRYYLLMLPFLILLGYFIETNTNFRPENAGHYEKIQDQK